MSTAKLPKADRSIKLILAPAKFCPRKLTNDGLAPCAKRYMGVGKPLFGYMMACPGCAFVEMHEDRKASFVEEDGILVTALRPLRCLYCARTLSIAGGAILAMTPPPLP